MSVDYRGFAAVGFKVTADEVATLSEEVYETLIDNDTLILLDSWTAGSDYLFVYKQETADEGTCTSILSLYNKLNYEYYKDFIDLFKFYFPNSEAQLDVFLACQCY